jgi:hypothetical protein
VEHCYGSCFKYGTETCDHGNVPAVEKDKDAASYSKGREAGGVKRNQSLNRKLILVCSGANYCDDGEDDSGKSPLCQYFRIHLNDFG